MGKRGPKSVNLGVLSSWEFEFYKAFHLLRDGTPLPSRYASPRPHLRPEELLSFLKQLQHMTPEQYWLTGRRLAAEMGEKVNLQKPPIWMERQWAEQEQQQEIFSLKQALKPVEAQARRRKLWEALIEANTYAAVRKVCGRWARLPDVQFAGLQPFPGHVLANAVPFFRMKRNKRFPHSSYGDDARVDYLARGMAGVMMGRSPMTAIERLRNMRHVAGGPLWDERAHRCNCWRCSLSRANELENRTQVLYDNGLKVFMELAATTKVPTEWKQWRKAQT